MKKHPTIWKKQGRTAALTNPGSHLGAEKRLTACEKGNSAASMLINQRGNIDICILSILMKN